ncbi:hypothetical protein [Polluticaenibacter yanchengensis]|uniref:Uncharacterized protein n=1 Tax=Polluticaenibacter yanchengensis TaxID=3014562 RepID=A0ABT4UEU5_9BACT|nr:hypothetical protein [Chitinophagaceae bacterium LY-5]
MKGQELKIIFKDNHAFLTNEVALNFNQVQISAIYEPIAKEQSYWKIRVINYIQSENKLHVDVIKHFKGATNFEAFQLEYENILMTIEQVTFKNINTHSLTDTFILNAKVKEHLIPTFLTNTTPAVIKQPTINQPTIIKGTFTIPILDITFIAGAITFEKKFALLQEPVKFTIPNETIIEAFDAVKAYFSKVLNTNKITVDAIVEIQNGQTITKASSSEIEKIDYRFIEYVKTDSLKRILKKEPISEKQVYTIEEYINDIKKQSLFKDGLDFFDSLLELPNAKHYKHLKFLSGLHQHKVLKLRFVHDPVSFIFLLQNNHQYHIVWETLYTKEATYIWSSPKDTDSLKRLLTQVEDSIKLINESGKIAYIELNEPNFSRIYHHYNNKERGFEEWQNNINGLL